MQSFGLFKITKRNEEDINQRPNRLRDNILATPSKIYIEVPSATALLEETININQIY